MTWTLLIALSFLCCYDTTVNDDDHHLVAGVGDVVHLPCSVNTIQCGEYHSIKWYKAGRRVAVYSKLFKHTEDERATMSVDDDHAYLTIAPVEVYDQGHYKCETTYLDASDNCLILSNIYLVTVARPSYIRISLNSVEGERDVSNTMIGPYNQGTPIILACEAGGGKPSPRVRWVLGTDSIEGKESIFEHSNLTGTARSEIRINVSRKHLGSKIQCIVENEAITKGLTAFVQIDVNLRPFSTVITGNHVGIREGVPSVFVCVSRGARPGAVITWYNGSEALVDTENQPVRHLAVLQDDSTYTTTSKLVIIPTRFHHNKTIHCQAKNEVQENQNYAPQVDSFTLQVNFAPVVSLVSQTLFVNETDSFQVSCAFVANPRELVGVVWFHNDTPLSTGRGRYDLIISDTVNLVVRQARRNDSGLYFCRLSNLIGQGQPDKSTSVEVFTKPTVRIRMNPVSPIREGEQVNVTLLCDIVEGNPFLLTQVRWFMDNILLNELPQCNLKSEDNLCDVDPSKLILESVNRHFSGNFSCVGSTAGGQSLMSNLIPLEVHYPPGKAEVILSSVKVVKEGSLSLHCSLADPGLPPATYFKWTIGSTLVTEQTSNNWTIHSVTYNMSHTSISCQGGNEVGKGSIGTKDIEVIAPPRFLANLPPMTGYPAQAEHVSLSCQVECSPLCQVGWYRNGSYIRNKSSSFTILSQIIPHNLHNNTAQSTLSTLIFNMKHWPGKQLDRERDNTEYSCMSTSNCKEDITTNCEGVRSVTRFYVEFPPQNINISDKEISVEENEIPIQILCTAEAFPEPSFSWIFRGQEIQTGAVLHFSEGVSRDQSGPYTCQANNLHGSEIIRTVITVLYQPKCTIFLIKKKETFVLECKADGNPKNFRFSWVKDNITHSTVEHSQDQSSFLEFESKEDQLGVYYCRVNNRLGSGNLCKMQVDFQKLGISPETTESLIIAGSLVSSIILVILCLAALMCTITRYYRPRKKGMSSSRTILSLRSPPDVTKDIHPSYSKYHSHGNTPASYNKLDVTLVCDDSKTCRGTKIQENILL